MKQQQAASPLAHPANGNLDQERDALDALVEQYTGDLIGLIQAVQQRYGYLPADILAYLAGHAAVPLARIYGVATFYSNFTLHPRGRHVLRVCEGTACHVRGASRIKEALSDALGIDVGETTADRAFSLETAACLGCCSLAPVVAVGEAVHGDMSPDRATALVAGGVNEAQDDT